MNIWRVFFLVVGAPLLPLAAAGDGPANKCTEGNKDNPTAPTECGTNSCYEVTTVVTDTTYDFKTTDYDYFYDGYYQDGGSDGDNAGTATSSAEVGNFVCAYSVGASVNAYYPWRYCCCGNPAPVTCASTDTASVNGDPHIKLPEGGEADLKGEDGVFYNLVSAAGFSFSMMTSIASFMLPRPLLVHGSFFTQASCLARGHSGKTYAILGNANEVGFEVLDQRDGTLLARHHGVWQGWSNDGVMARVKQATTYVRANGWEVNVTRRPIYNLVSGPSSWRYDMQLRKLDGTAFEAEFGRASRSCFPHGIIGQAFDGDGIGVSGKLDDYNAAFHAPLKVLTTTAQAEGAIEGESAQYKMEGGPLSANFAYSRFDKAKGDVCAPRDVKKLSGAKVASGPRKDEVASTTEKMDEALAAAPL